MSIVNISGKRSESLLSAAGLGSAGREGRALNRNANALPVPAALRLAGMWHKRDHIVGILIRLEV